MARPLVTCDVECHPNYFLIKFKTIADGRVRAFEQFDGHPLDRDGVRTILRQYTIITFNGNSYDKFQVVRALQDGCTNADLKELNDRIIVGRMKPWEIEREYNMPMPSYLDHIDLIEPAPAVMVGLKMYGGRLHAPKLQDLPYDPDARLTRPQMIETNDYCGNDLDTTILLYNAIKESIDLRIHMSTEYGVDLRSKSDAQIGETLLRMAVEKRLGRKVYKPELPRRYSFQYKAPAFIRFKTAQMQDVLATVQAVQFFLDKGGSPMIPKAIEALKIVIGGNKYTMAIGGLHSCESKVAHFADDDYLLRDIDVRSFYPNIILNQRLFPKHLGPALLIEYKKIVLRRLAAKDAGDKVTDGGLKIAINGSYGKFGSKYSVLYAPDLMLQVTLTGQLALFMLIESFEAVGINVVSTNTDGIVTKCPRDMEDTMKAIVADWEFMTSFEMESTDYAALYSRDVNNYIAVKPDGKVKCKGAFSRNISVVDGKERFELKKTPTTEICVDAVIANITKGIPVMRTIRACKDIRKFISVRRVTGGAYFVNREHKAGVTPRKKYAALVAAGWCLYSAGDESGPLATSWTPPGITPERGQRVDAVALNHAYDVITRQDTDDKYLGKVVRWAYAAQGKGHIRNNKGSKVAKTDGCRPVMDLPDKFPDWIDHEWYAKEAISMLADLGAM